MERLLIALRRAGWKVAQHADRSDGRVHWTMTHPERDPLAIDADNDAKALNIILKQAGIAPERRILNDNGPWSAGIEKDRVERVFIQSEDFAHDARLYLDGDFATQEDAHAYAVNLAAALNAIPKPVEREAKGVTGRLRKWIRNDAKGRITNAIIGVLTVALFVLLAIYVVPERIDPTLNEAGAGAYRDAKTAIDVCPPARPAIGLALRDGRISIREAEELHDIVRSFADNYQAADELAKARTALGLRNPPLPPKCSGIRPQGKDDYGPPADLFQDYRLDHDD